MKNEVREEQLRRIVDFSGEKQELDKLKRDYIKKLFDFGFGWKNMLTIFKSFRFKSRLNRYDKARAHLCALALRYYTTYYPQEGFRFNSAFGSFILRSNKEEGVSDAEGMLDALAEVYPNVFREIIRSYRKLKAYFRNKQKIIASRSVDDIIFFLWTFEIKARKKKERESNLRFLIKEFNKIKQKMNIA